MILLVDKFYCLIFIVSILSCQNIQYKSANQVNNNIQNKIILSAKNDSIKLWEEVSFKETKIIEKMAYADTANFLHQKIYPCAKCFLRPEVANALLKANQLAQQENVQLVIFDCYRPKKYQQKMFDIVKNADYVAEPTKGSMHNKGLAIDIALADHEKLLDFGTSFDDFSEKAQYNYPNISSQAKKNRKKLRNIMTQAGFEPYDKEWWHFNYKKIDYPVDDFIWNCP